MITTTDLENLAEEHFREVEKERNLPVGSYTAKQSYVEHLINQEEPFDDWYARGVKNAAKGIDPSKENDREEFFVRISDLRKNGLKSFWVRKENKMTRIVKATNQPYLTVVFPWKYQKLIKSIQRKASSNDNVYLRGNREGLKVISTPQGFLDLGIAKISSRYSSLMISKLRQAKVPILSARTVHLPGKVSVVEVRLGCNGDLRKVANALVGEGPPEVLTVYGGDGRGHTRVAGDVRVGFLRRDSEGQPGDRGAKRTGKRTAAEKKKHNDLVESIKKIWEKEGEDLASTIDWDNSDYEAPTAWEITMDNLNQYLTPEQLEKWNDLEPEAQSEIMNEVFPYEATEKVNENLEKHFSRTWRGSSKEEKPSTLEATIDPLDIGLRDKENPATLPGGTTISNLFSD